MPKRFAVSLLVVLFAAAASFAAEHRVEVLKEGPPVDELPKAIAEQLDSTGVKIVRGTSRTICEIWLCKEVSVSAEFEPTDELIYPFQPGQLIGVARYKNKGADFRDQDIDKGLYTLRFAHQPVDGSHIGTSPTRDFLLLLNAEKDKSPATLDYKKLTTQSAEAAGSSHPAMLSMQRVHGKPGEKPTLRHNEEHDWWILSFVGNVKAGKETKKLPIDLVVVGVAAE